MVCQNSAGPSCKWWKRSQRWYFWWSRLYILNIYIIWNKYIYQVIHVLHVVLLKVLLQSGRAIKSCLASNQFMAPRSTAEWTIGSAGLAQSNQTGYAECMTTGDNLIRTLIRVIYWRVLATKPLKDMHEFEGLHPLLSSCNIFWLTHFL